MDVLMDILTIFCQKSGCGASLPTPPSTSQHSNQFPVAGRVECGGWRVHSRAYSLALSKWTVVGAALIWACSRNRWPL
jgi:hypothetical protein